jgi:hypothetical protein
MESSERAGVVRHRRAAPVKYKKNTGTRQYRTEDNSLVDRITNARRSVREPAAARISGMDNLEAVTIHIGVGKLAHKSVTSVVQSTDDDITKSDIYQV